MSDKPPTCEMIGDDASIFIVIDGLKVAKRGEPGTPHAKTWVSIEPGWSVFDVRADRQTISVTYNGASVH